MAEVLQSQAGVDYYSQGLRGRYHLDSVRAKPATVDNTVYADIKYKLDENKYHERTKQILESGGLPTTVPAGFPEKLEGPLVWTSTNFPREEEYVYHLTADDLVEIGQALAFFKEQGLELDEVDRDSFPLPGLGKCLSSLADDIYNGRGFAIVRGLDPEMFSTEDHAIVYLGVSSYIAERRGKQDQRGSMLIHAIASDNTNADPTNADKPFHNDTVTDTLALITKSCSAAGGGSILASAWTVYNELAATRPDILHVLAAPDWPFDTYGRAPPFYLRSLLYYHDGKAMINMSRRLLVGHEPFEPRSKGIPGLTERQAEAVDAVHYIAEKHSIRTSMHKGDMRFINNMALLHRREAFENDQNNQRHLIRIWLNNEAKNWKLPEPLRLAWARVFDDPERDAHWDIAPIRGANGRVLHIARSCD